jgi:transposase
VQEFPATAVGYVGLTGWLGGFGTVALVGIEGTGSYGAGLTRHMAAAGIRVVEVDRPDRQDRRRQGKSDPLDALRELGRRAQFLDGQIEHLGGLIIPLVTARAPSLLALHGVGPDTAALLLIAAGDHPQRLRSEAAWAHLCAVAPIPASSGKVRRHRLNPGGNREASHALWRIVITRMSARPATRAYVDRRTKEGLSKKEIIRCLKRYVAREVYRHLRTAG